MALQRPRATDGKMAQAPGACALSWLWLWAATECLEQNSHNVFRGLLVGAERHAAAHGLHPPASRLSSPPALSGRGQVD